MLESGTSRGLVRIRGTAVRLEGDLVRFTVDGPPQIVQRRQFVRVIAPQPVTLDDDDGWAARRVGLRPQLADGSPTHGRISKVGRSGIGTMIHDALERVQRDTIRGGHAGP